MKTIIVALAVALLLSACSISDTEGCWITHANGVKLNTQVQLPNNGEALAMSPGRSYQISCARKIDSSNMGDIISEDQRTLRIAALPRDAELQIYPNERDKVYLGHSVSSSANVWMSFEKASSQTDIADVAWPVASFVLGLAITLAIAMFILYRRRTPEGGDGAAPRF